MPRVAILQRPSTLVLMFCRHGCCCLLLAWLVACSEVVSGSGPHTFVAPAAARHTTSPSGQVQPRLPLDDATPPAAAAGESTAASGEECSSNTNHKHLVAWARPRGDSKGRDIKGGEGSRGGGGLGGLLSSWGESTKEPIARWKARHGRYLAHEDVNRKAQAAARAAGLRPDYKLTFWGCMVAGAVSRSVAQTSLHPANVIKTLLQTKGSFKAILPLTWATLSRGAGAQFLLSLPNGALHFAVLENTKARMADIFPVKSASFLLDFASCSAATTLCSVMSTPQMVLTNRIMAGVYPNLWTGVRSVIREKGVRGFYAGWWPGLVQKIPSYGLTWVLYQQVKDLHYRVAKRLPSNTENFWLGCVAAAGSVTIMIPMDTVKTRLVTQSGASTGMYNGIVNCFTRMLREEGLGSFYNSLTPRLVSVVPMIGVQYLVYEFMKKLMAEVPEAVAPVSKKDQMLAQKKVLVEELETVTEG
ncbi:unnamed protein product [Scytosiphon promiscuus]